MKFFIIGAVIALLAFIAGYRMSQPQEVACWENPHYDYANQVCWE